MGGFTHSPSGKCRRYRVWSSTIWDAAGEYIEAVGWTGDDVWHAHCVQLNSEEINLFAKQEQVSRIVPAPICDLQVE